MLKRPADSLCYRNGIERSASVGPLEDGSFAALVADINLPGVDGYEFIRRVRATPALAKIKAVAVTALGTEEDKVAAHKAGFDAHMNKPVDFPQLVRTIEMLLDVGGE